MARVHDVDTDVLVIWQGLSPVLTRVRGDCCGLTHPALNMTLLADMVSGGVAVSPMAFVAFKLRLLQQCRRTSSMPLHLHNGIRP